MHNYFTDEELFRECNERYVKQCPAVSLSKKSCFRIAGHDGKHYFKRYYTNINGNIKFKRVTFTKEREP